MRRSKNPTLLGSVEGVTGLTLNVSLDSETLSGLVYIEGQGHRVGQVGSFVRLPQGFTQLFGIVTQAGMAPASDGSAARLSDAGRQTIPPSADLITSRRWLTVEIIGEGAAGEAFNRGVRTYPTIGDEVHLVTEHDLGTLYGREVSRDHVEVGTLSSARAIPARIDVNKLVTRHSAVLGSTGSGKSTTVASIVESIADPQR